MPILECDYFQHKQKIKIFKVKRKITPNKLYTSSDVGRILETIMSKLGGNIAEVSRDGFFEVYYGETFIKLFDTFLEAEQFKNNNFKDLDKVIIKRKGE